MIVSKRALAAIAVACLVLAAGCSGVVDDPGNDTAEPADSTDGNETDGESVDADGDDGSAENDSETDGDDEVDAVAAALLDRSADVETYRFETIQRVNATDGDVTTRSNGTVDRADRRLAVETTTESVTEVGEQVVGVEQYVIGTDVYVKQDGDVRNPGVWQRTTALEEQLWNGTQRLGPRPDLLESGELEAAGTETVNGVETTVIRVEASEKLRSQVLAEAGLEETGGTIEELRYRLYVDEDTGLLLRTEMELTGTQGEESFEVAMTTTFFDHDEPVEIELPDAAAEAGDGDDDAGGGDE